MDNLILALDVGTTGIKLALVDSSGITQFAQHRTYETRFMTGNRTEQDPNDWWEAAAASIRNLRLGKRELFARISAVAVTGQMQNLILTRAKEPVMPAILYTDMRAGEEAEFVNQTVGTEALRRITGNDQDGSSLLAKLLWVKKHNPKALTDADAVLIGAHDYIVLKLCGEAVSDVVTASTTGLMNLADRAWATDIFSAIGLPKLPLGRIVPGGTQVGELDGRIAALVGLPKGLPVCHGPGDAGATTLGAGAGEPGSVYGYLGTSGWVAFSATHRGSPDQGVWTLSHPKQEYLIPIAPILTSGGCLEWLREEFKEGRNYSDYIRLAEQAAPSELLFLPYLSGERSPFRDPDARGAFLGLSRRTTLKDMYRAVFEGVAYAYRHLLDALGVDKPTSLVITGGGTKSRYWMQLFANILNTPVVVPIDPQNVGVRGAVLAAWVAQKQFSNYAPPEFFHNEYRVEPQTENRKSYDAYYEVYRDLYKALHPGFVGMQKAFKIRAEEIAGTSKLAGPRPAGE